MLEKILNEMIEKGKVIDRYNQDNKNGKYYTYYEIEYNGETFEIMCVNGECKSIEKVWKNWRKGRLPFLFLIVKIVENFLL